VLVTLLDEGGVHDVNKGLNHYYRQCFVKKTVCLFLDNKWSSKYLSSYYKYKIRLL